MSLTPMRLIVLPSFPDSFPQKRTGTKISRTFSVLGAPEYDEEPSGTFALPNHPIS